MPPTLNPNPLKKVLCKSTRNAEDILCVQLAGAGAGAVGGSLLANKQGAQGAGGQGLGSQGAAGQVCRRNQAVPLFQMLPPSGHSIL